ncbi:MAG: hypothetical protein ACLUT5_12670 [Butyricicoccus sp.]
MSLWSDIVAHHTQLQTIRAVRTLTAAASPCRRATRRSPVAVEDHVQPVSAMEQLT